MEYILLWVVDVQLLQEEAVVQKATAYFSQELQDDAPFRAQENNGVVAIGPGSVINCNASKPISGRVRNRERTKCLRQQSRDNENAL